MSLLSRINYIFTGENISFINRLDVHIEHATHPSLLAHSAHGTALFRAGKTGLNMITRRGVRSLSAANTLLAGPTPQKKRRLLVLKLNNFAANCQ